MRKITGSFILAIALLSLGPSTVQADELSISVGIKARYNELIIRLINESVKFGGNSQDSRLLLGPSFKLSYGNFFGGMSWLQTIGRYSMEFVSFTADEEGSIDMRGKYEETMEYIGKAAPVSIPG